MVRLALHTGEVVGSIPTAPTRETPHAERPIVWCSPMVKSPMMHGMPQTEATFLDDISDEALEAAAGCTGLAMDEQLAAGKWTEIPLICAGTLKPRD